MPNYTNQRQAVTAIANREDFEASALSGSTNTPWESGRLSGADRAQFVADRFLIAYVVRSYATPIAWVTTDGRKHIVSQRFTTTTRKHQAIVRQAL